MELSLTDLPADVLLGVMQHVDVPDLLACRLVCKRLHGLALQPDAWRHRQLHGNRHTPQALRLAPCLKAWKLHLTSQVSRLPLALCTATKCAVTQLGITITTKHIEFEVTGRVIRNQAALGRLRRLQLILKNLHYRIGDVELTKLLATAVLTGGLEKLTIICFNGKLPSPDTPALLAGPAPSPSVKTLHFSLSPATEPFVSFVLAAHAATLEKVSLGESPCSWSASSSIAAQLAGMPNLRELTCCLLPGLQAAAACKSLRHFELLVYRPHLNPDDEALRRNLLDAGEFLRRADQLESVRLEYLSDDVRVGPSVLSLSPRSRPQRLVIVDDHYFEQDSDYPHLQPLLAALPSLTALHHLELNAVVLDGLAGALTPVTAPALRTLKLRPVQGRTPCAHAYLHSRSMATLLADNPALQVHVHARNVCLEVDTCETCRRHCHQELRCIRWLTKGEMLSDDRKDVADFQCGWSMWINITRCNLLFNNGSRS
ncbi:uncharacterized protein LOC113213172 [Frankliniella occidentalis]|uniref:Uncharacterized protein LOC113213172 n=1 Tax=Frankliniella occidentalis TaxID=133901 RepID=A0A6J1T8D8_FRAOC|nr:uncharacterized protein LOC113213172 [Frankliniella occidentalis]